MQYKNPALEIRKRLHGSQYAKKHPAVAEARLLLAKVYERFRWTPPTEIVFACRNLDKAMREAGKNLQNSPPLR